MDTADKDDGKKNTSLAPAKIRKLDQSVVNKIAAGEIIIQPCNALKEMLENSIDANSTSIDVLVKDGGLKLLQISDNGSGICKDDLALLCERFATSKLQSFDDLSSIATYGFRGEALASISHISHLSVISKVKDSPLGYKAYYLNGKLCTSKFKTDAGTCDPKPVAGKDGTQITVEDLFYNSLSRLQALKSKNEEWMKVLDIAGKYAVHSEGIGISCKKFGETLPAISTRPHATLKERIRVVFGSPVANNLIEFEFSGSAYGVGRVKGAVSGLSYNNKRRAPPIFFINNRLVTCDPLKRGVNSIYSLFLPKGNYPFVYISLDIAPQNLDVNIHPTKREVRFLNEDEIIEWVCGKLHDVLSENDTHRTFNQSSVKRSQNDDSLDRITEGNKKSRNENKLVRVDASQSKINQFIRTDFQDVLKSAALDDGVPVDEAAVTEISPDSLTESSKKRQVQYPEYNKLSKLKQDIQLDSVQELREELIGRIHRPLTNVFNNLVAVGIVDSNKRLFCFQYDVKLFLCDYAAVLFDFFYQIALSDFGNYGEYRFDKPIALRDILASLYESRDDLMDLSQVINNITAMSDMLSEYFGISITEEKLSQLPLLLKGVLPSTQKLPLFVYRLGAKVNYEDEKECLNAIMKQLALLFLPDRIARGTSDEETQLALKEEEKLGNLLEHTVFPELRKRFIASEALLESVIQVADLPGLYRVFERC